MNLVPIVSVDYLFTHGIVKWFYKNHSFVNVISKKSFLKTSIKRS